MSKNKKQEKKHGGVTLDIDSVEDGSEIKGSVLKEKAKKKQINSSQSEEMHGKQGYSP